MNDEQRIAIAAECLRQVWQCFDAAGISMGRSQQALLLESAMTLIPYDHRHSDLADVSPREFDKMRANAVWQKMREEIAARDKEMGLEPIAEGTPNGPR